MNNIDIKSVIIGFLGSCLVFLLIAADDLESNNKNFGDIVVNSITIKDDGHGGFITAYNQDQKRTLYLGTGKDANGYKTIISTRNQRHIGSNRDMDGVIVLSDRYSTRIYSNW